MHWIKILLTLVFASTVVAEPTGRWAGSSTIPGWPPVFTVVDFDADGATLSMLQANLLDTPLGSFELDGETFSCTADILGTVYRFEGGGSSVLEGTVAGTDDGAQAGGSFAWTPHPPVATMKGAVSYSGTLSIGAVTSIGMVIDHARDASGRLHADISIPMQKLSGYPLEVKSESEGSAELVLAASGMPAVFTVPLKGETIDVVFSQGGFSSTMPMQLDADPQRSQSRPQDPKPPFPYESREVLVSHPDGHSLAGTLTVPPGAGPHPAAILISGSGPQDRNEEIMGHRPFLVLSDHLTRQGIAVLRFDDRGVGGSVVPDPASLRDVTTLDFASDTSVLVDHLRAQPGIDPDRIGLIGHSEGGIVAPLVADQRDDIAFVVLLAAPGRRGVELLPDQGAMLMKAAGVEQSVLDETVAQHALVLKMLVEGADRKTLREPMRTLSHMQVGAMGLDVEVTDQFVEDAIDQSSSPWITWFLAHDPAPVLARLDMPVYAINGELDLQVPAGTELALIEEVMRRSGGDLTARSYPGLNHLFQPATTGAVEEYATIEITMDPMVMAEMARWINERMATNE